ncbi:hypothetical protein EKK97_04985 [Billgrantia tianxiuensis]|uniref:Uncharacterized protein n=1 Tax=Billgrantia tianxiuensis TaxID=2497861 RepID=A0A6I6SMK6_9GAMM|nr:MULTISPECIES: hypothetical protein [Halomonas]MCE8033375.1 hypothetical protein [Halomonas sp. MCCC 1A11057]QHC49100.1 hypothetical protein EKK97_04985 [Halomonas tianxiuensis]
MIATTTGATQMPGLEGASGSTALADQNLFEHMARTSGSNHGAVTPAELGESLFDRMSGSIEQLLRPLQGAGEGDASRTVASREAAQGESSAQGEGAEALGDVQFERMLEGLREVFDHACNAKLLATGAGQVSGTCSTVLRG